LRAKPIEPSKLRNPTSRNTHKYQSGTYGWLITASELVIMPVMGGTRASRLGTRFSGLSLACKPRVFGAHRPGYCHVSGTRIGVMERGGRDDDRVIGPVEPHMGGCGVVVAAAVVLLLADH